MRTDEQLRAVFNATFDELPEDVRISIEELWRDFKVEREVGGQPGRFRPSVLKQAVLSETPSLTGETNGLFFRFKSSVVDTAPDDVLKILIAHELAHAARAAQRVQGLIPPQTTVDAEENAANALQKDWGFGREELLLWLGENIIALQI